MMTAGPATMLTEAVSPVSTFGRGPGRRTVSLNRTMDASAINVDVVITAACLRRACNSGGAGDELSRWPRCSDRQ